MHQSLQALNGDSVLINAGNTVGHFVLFFQAEDTCGGTFCEHHVYVDNPLPVELASFTSDINQRNVTLNWTTATENNNSGFDIERSIENDRWSKINFVYGQGTVSTQTNYKYEDKNLSSGRYKYRLKQIDYNGIFRYYVLANEVIIGVPEKFSLSQNYPNPFNPATTINYSLPGTQNTILKIFDINGKEVVTLVNMKQDAGYYSVEFNGSNFSSGIYFYRLEAGNFVATRKMMIVK